MNQYKFRAWNKNYKSMVGWEEIMNSFRVNEFFAPQDDFILMQWTGLTDKNGTDIYEGDIVEWAGKYNDDIASYSLDGKDVDGVIGTVKVYPSKGVVVKLAHKYTHIIQHAYNTNESKYTTSPIWKMWNSKEEWAVVGNIHENPEIMEA